MSYDTEMELKKQDEREKLQNHRQLSKHRWLIDTQNWALIKIIVVLSG